MKMHYAHSMSWGRIAQIVGAFVMIPLAGLIGTATEELSIRIGPTYGGLLNATFGNAAATNELSNNASAK